MQSIQPRDSTARHRAVPWTQSKAFSFAMSRQFWQDTELCRRLKALAMALQVWQGRAVPQAQSKAFSLAVAHEALRGVTGSEQSI